jgi:hypothetical protein
MTPAIGGFRGFLAICDASDEVPESSSFLGILRDCLRVRRCAELFPKSAALLARRNHVYLLHLFRHLRQFDQ